MPKNNVTTVEIKRYLDKKGLSHAVQGFLHLTDAIKVCISDPDYRFKICALYAKVAKNCESTPSRVERTMRHCIQTANLDIPTSEFIARALDDLEAMAAEQTAKAGCPATATGSYPKDA